MSPPRLTRIAVVAVMFIAGTALALLNGDLFSVWFFLGYAIPGGLLVERRPRNVIGWLMLGTGWALCIASLFVHATPEALATGTASVADDLLAWGIGWGWTAVLASLFAISILFPDGRLPKGRWRVPAVALMVLAVVTVLVTAFGPHITVTLQGGDTEISVPNPFALLPSLPFWKVVPSDDIVIVVTFGLLVVGAASLVVRYVRAAGRERLQIRWLVTAFAVVTVAGLIGLLAFQFIGGAAWLLVAFAYPSIPAAIAVAVLRYRLYDIDVVINRTLVYGSATLLLAAAFGLANVAAQRLLTLATGTEHSDIATAGLAIAAALAFTPISRRLRPIADRLLPSRSMLALLFTDIVESTRKAVELGDQAWRELLERYRSVVRRELARFGGHEVDTAGDGFFATFERPAAAVACALEVRKGVRRMGLESRIGLHYGECEMRGEKVTGVAVHAAARVMSAAGPDEILVTDALRDATASGHFSTTDAGRHELKGVPGEWQLYAIESADTTADASGPMVVQPD